MQGRGVVYRGIGFEPNAWIGFLFKYGNIFRLGVSSLSISLAVSLDCLRLFIYTKAAGFTYFLKANILTSLMWDLG